MKKSLCVPVSFVGGLGCCQQVPDCPALSLFLTSGMLDPFPPDLCPVGCLHASLPEQLILL